MAVHAIAASEDGQYVAWSEAGRLVVVDALRRIQVGELAIELQPPLSLAVSTDPYRLVVVQTRGAATLVRVLSVPELEPLAEGTLPASARLVAVCGATAVLLGTGDTLTLLDLATLHATTLTVRGPIQAVAPFSASQVLIAARGKLETWSLEERRPTHRLAFALPRQPVGVGVAAHGSLLWTASAEGAISCYRLSDGTVVSEGSVGARPMSVSASPTQPTLIAVALPATGEVVALDLLTGERRSLSTGAPIGAACIANGDAIVLPEQGAPVQVALTGTEAPRRLVIAEGAAVLAEASSTNTAASMPPPAPHPVASRLDEWRAQVREAVQITTGPTETAPRRPAEEPRSRTRAELVAWADNARTRKTTAPPAPPQVWKLGELAQRFSLDLRSRTLLALLYGAWLDGDGKTGIPVAQAARVLGNEEQAWIDALAQGRLGRLDWVRASYGRIRLRPQIGRFLDEAAPGIQLVVPTAGSTRRVEPPALASLWPGDGDLDARLRDLADTCHVLVASVDLDALPTARFDRALDSKLLEARLYGALPVLHCVGGVMLDVARLAEPMLLTCRATAPLPWTKLPSWPPPVQQEAAG